MKIVVCGSMVFAQQMIQIKKRLEAKNHQVVLPEFVRSYVIDPKWQKKATKSNSMIDAQRKIKYNLIKKHYHEIKNSEAILVLNQDKRGIKNYIGGNTFLEMGFAYILNKKIFVLNPLPRKMAFIYQELLAMRPTIINGKLGKIK